MIKVLVPIQGGQAKLSAKMFFSSEKLKINPQMPSTKGFNKGEKARHYS